MDDEVFTLFMGVVVGAVTMLRSKQDPSQFWRSLFFFLGLMLIILAILSQLLIWLG